MLPSEVAGIPVYEECGTERRLGDFGADPLVVVLVRYYGCLPCQAFLSMMDRRRQSLPPSTRIIAVGGSAPHQVRWLQEKRNIDMSLLLEPDQLLRDHVGFGNLTIGQWLDPRGSANYVKAMMGGLPPQLPTKDTVRTPGVAIFDPGFELLWSYEGERIGDYPVPDVLFDVINGFSAAA